MLIVYAGPQDYFLPGLPMGNTPFEFNGTPEELEHLKQQGFVEVQAEAQVETPVEAQAEASQPTEAVAEVVTEGDPNSIV